jgi:S-methylmethionine-dependent homocysteine/selenocysteine methylase
MTDNISWLEDRVGGKGAPLVIDGGMGTQLEKSGVPMDDKVWSARAILSHPEAVRQAHEEFITAGAEVIITNTISAARHMLESGGLGDHVKEINRNAVKLAQQARDSVAKAPVAIAGSICEWTLRDNPNRHTPEAVGRFIMEQAEILAEAGVDLIALEMCQITTFSVAAANAVMQVGLPFWIGLSARTHKGSNSLSVFDHKQADFESPVKALAEFPTMMLNIMHTPVSDVDRAMEIVKRYWNGPVGVYPESGYFIMPNWQFVDVIEPDELAKIAQVWIDNGARMVGGCCGLGPEHIAALRQALNQVNRD